MAVGTEVPPAEDTSAIDENTVNDTEQAADNAEMGGEDGTASEEEQIEVTIMHLEEDGQGEVEQIVDMTETDQIQAIEKTEQQEVCKVERTCGMIKEFSLNQAQEKRWMYQVSWIRSYFRKVKTVGRS